MKKTILMIVVMVFAVTLAMAQETEKAESPWGFEAGVGLASIEGGDGDGAGKNYLGFEAGTSYFLEKAFFEATISYFRKAYDDYTTSWEALTLKANYVPVDGFYFGLHYGIRPSRTKWHESGNVYKATLNGPGVQAGLCFIKHVTLEYNYSWITVVTDNHPNRKGYISRFGLKYFF